MFSSNASYWNGIAALFAASFMLASTVQAQECDIKNVTADGSDKLPDIGANFTCVTAKLNAALSRIERLESDLEAFRFAKNAVLAFNTDKNAPCPRGWKIFDEPSGRFIVGAGFGDGLTPRNVKDKGGEESHKLTELEMPAHDHSSGNFNQLMKLSGGWTAKVGDDGFNEPTLNVSKQISRVGGDQPHNTMPPFVALYYCIKE